MHLHSVRIDHCTNQYRFFAVSYRPGPIELQYSSREVYMSIARGTLTVTGNIVFQLPRRLAKPADVQWNGQYLVICYLSKEALILDFSHLLLL